MDQKEKPGLKEKEKAAADPVHKKKKRRRLLKTVLIVLAALLVIRIALPYVILHYANKKLATLDGYYGHVDDINLALIRGAYVIRDIRIDKVDSRTKDSTLFFKCPRIDLSVEWGAIFEGKFVGEVVFERPVVEYTMDKTVGKEAEEDTTDFIQLVKDFMPLRINRFAVEEGAIHYKDPTRTPAVDVPLTRLNVEATGLTNETDTKQLLPAKIDATAQLYNGNLSLSVKLDPLNKNPTFDMNTTLTETNLVSLNPFMQAYGNFDVKKGTMSMYAEFAAKEGKFRGYVKPILKDLDVVQLTKEEGTPLQVTWEAFVGTVAEVFQNQNKEQLATNVPVEGHFSNPEVGVIRAIFAVLRNAFVEALRPSLDNSVSIQTVEDAPVEQKEGFFKRVFKGDGKNKPDDKK